MRDLPGKAMLAPAGKAMLDPAVDRAVRDLPGKAMLAPRGKAMLAPPTGSAALDPRTARVMRTRPRRPVPGRGGGPPGLSRPVYSVS
ncbi:MAG TPA: hypothetical protein VLM79_34010 [Kofleriaceae bacterium]|nr:hypothetical protein [Kofleriaceae bacterium]